MTTGPVARPTTHWRALLGRDAGYETLFPEPMIADTDRAMSAFEEELGCDAGHLTDEQVFALAERFVRALNAVDEVHGRYETGERELLCDYLDSALAAAGVDVAGLVARRGIDRSELTDAWRDW